MKSPSDHCALERPTNQGPVPFLVGITGHRDLRSEDQNVVEASLQRIFQSLIRAMPMTPVWLITGMASGADQVVAQIAQKQGLRVVPILPMPRQDYEQDFSETELATFRALMQGHAAVELPWIADPTKQNRSRQYQALGTAISNHCQLLIALWDGSEGLDGPCAPGGTADVVRQHLRGIAPDIQDPERALDLSPFGVVAHIVTPRLKHPVPKQPAGMVQWLTVDPLHPTRCVPERLVRERLAGWTMRTDRLNREILKGRSTPLPESTDPGVVLQARYQEIDAVASRLQRRAMGKLPRPTRGILEEILRGLTLTSRMGVIHWVYALGFLGVALQQAAPVLSSLLPTYLGFLPTVLGYVLMLCALAIHVIAWWRDLSGRYLDYRALAEGLRVALVWRQCGSTESVADHYLSRHRGSADWVRLVVRSLELEARLVGTETKIPTLPQEELRTKLRQNWLCDQQQYFSRALERDAWNLGRFQRLAMIFMLSCVVVGIMQSFITMPAFVSFLTILMQFASLALFAFPGAIALAEHANAYRRSEEIFSRAITWLDAGGDPKAVAHALGRESLDENAHWLVLHRQKPVDVAYSGLLVKLASAIRPFFTRRF